MASIEYGCFVSPAKSAQSVRVQRHSSSKSERPGAPAQAGKIPSGTLSQALAELHRLSHTDDQQIFYILQCSQDATFSAASSWPVHATKNQ